MSNIPTQLGIALATGVAVSFVTTVIFLPASYILNKILDHTWIMRAVIGVFAILVSPFLFIGISLLRLVYLTKADYLNLLPVFDTVTQIPFFKPFTWVYDEEKVRKILVDTGAIETTKKGVLFVDEELFKSASNVAVILKEDDWRPAYGALLERAKARVP